jgi:hypothetical protein
MALPLKFVLPVNYHLSGEKNGLKIGKMLSTAAKGVLVK